MSIIDKVKIWKRVGKTASQRNQDDALYHALTPNNDIQNGQEYMAALDWALNQDDIRNIAISGPYGSGKSSVISTYFKERDRKNVLFLSLAAFNLESMHASKDGGEDEELEIGILKQLFYRVRAEKIPRSRYRKLQPEKWWVNIVVGALVGFLLLTLLYFAFPDKTNTFIASVNGLPDVLRILLFIAVPVSVWYACFAVVKWFRRNGSLQEIKILDKATIKNADKENKESVFNRNMDEIVYFFEETGYRIVVIEDLDRFESSNIFVALRELNNLLNHYEGIAEKVTFIYAIKDEMFQKAGERTKFFDFIIPIIPYISSTNSGEILRQKLLFDEEKNKSRLYDISGQFISLISPYISDMRDLICICNEFIIFKNTLKGNQNLNLEDKHMFSLIVFKNLYPKDFAQLEDETEDSIVRQAFCKRREFIQKKELHVKTKRQEQEEIIQKVEQEVLRDVRDLKIALFMCAMNYESYITSIFYNDESYSFSDLLKDDFDVGILKNKQLRVHYAYDGRSTWTYIDDIEKKVEENGGDYFKRIDRVKKGLDNCKEDAKKKIEEYEQQLNALRTHSISQMIEEFGTDFLSEKVRENEPLGEKMQENELLVFLLRNGFIDENYTDYINYFYPNSITKDEMNFILAVRNHKSELDYIYPLKNVSRVFDRLQDYEFRQEEVFNYDLIDYVLEKKAGSSAEKFFIEKLSDHSQISMAFIKAYVERGHHIINRLFMLLCHANHHLWEDICRDQGISLETRFKYLGYMLSYAALEDIVAQDKVNEEDKILTEFFLVHPDVLEKLKDVPTEKQTPVIDALKLVFNDLETADLDESVRRYIFENCCYELNDTMLTRLVEWQKPKLAGELKKKNYTTVRALDYKPLTDYVHQNFDDYISQLILAVDSNTEEDIEAVEDIIELLFPGKIELALSVLEKEKVIWDGIEECCSNIRTHDQDYKQGIWNYLLENNRISCIWKNVEAYFREYGGNEIWLKYIVGNIDTLMLDVARSEVSNAVKQDLLFAEVPEEVFRKLIRGICTEAYSGILSKLNSMKIRVLVEERSLPFNAEYWGEMATIAPDLRPLYAEKNSLDFIQHIGEISIEVNEINKLIMNDAFSDAEKDAILTAVDPSEISIETARIIRVASRPISKEYVESAWQLLPEEEKYELLLNHIDMYKNDELPNLFAQLSSEYRQFVERSRHKYTIAVSDYNKALLEKLKNRDYITSVDESQTGQKGKEAFSNEKHILTGYVKQAK